MCTMEQTLVRGPSMHCRESFAFVLHSHDRLSSVTPLPETDIGFDGRPLLSTPNADDGGGSARSGGPPSQELLSSDCHLRYWVEHLRIYEALLELYRKPPTNLALPCSMPCILLVREPVKNHDQREPSHQICSPRAVAYFQVEL